MRGSLPVDDEEKGARRWMKGFRYCNTGPACYSASGVALYAVAFIERGLTRTSFQVFDNAEELDVLLPGAKELSRLAEKGL